MNLNHTADLLWQRLAGLLSGELKVDELGLLALPQLHPALLARRRATMIVNRVRLFALLFAVLTPLWSLIDLLVFPFPLWVNLALMRVLAGVTFASLVLHYKPSGELFDAYRAIALLFTIPTVFYIASATILHGNELTGFSAAMAAGYAFLPFVLLAGLSIFPLTLLENVIIASPILFAQGLAGAMGWVTLDWPSFAGAFWLLLLITGVSMLAGMSQLAFMMALVRQAIRDPLTGVFSRASAEEMLELQFTIARRSETALSVAFIDLDHFKGINDRFGHEAGDKALLDMTGTVSQHLRRGDLLTRWGGEEFLLIMPNTDLHQAHAAMVRMRGIGFGLRPDNTPLTASIGIAECGADQRGDWKSLVELADQRMYQAKQGGRDQVVGPPVAA